MKKFIKTISTIFLTIFMATTLVTLTSCNEPFDQIAAPTDKDTTATLTTNYGVIKIKLFSDMVPETVKNFEELASTGKYDNTIFHRIIKDFMMQGGDFESRNGMGGYSYKGPGTTIDLELDKRLTHIFGAVSMARKGNDVNSNGSQFFIINAEGGSHFLDGQYSVFGQVYEGIEVVKAIADVQTDPSDNKPLKDVVLQKVEITEPTN